ncbi:putative 2-aminoethylphosphonate ABC transporter permease subunit [Siccirubricoccus phaeus]|uniref:putative 2-aminoethylphosphonate ABC transporter permease subunit n=1 Tax=Siccirubricoccus phaeus TaxID=2595053 RepID=UPI0011F0B0BE|nr:putative 2-aminoethylphosphonate ABC transporter permease subunit [Siccirubricoccus phaeus]
MSESALGAVPRRRGPGDALLLRGLLGLSLLLLTLLLALPLLLLLLRAFETPAGGFAGLANFAAYAATPSLLAAAWNSIWTAGLTTLLMLPLAFFYAYALTRACIPARPFFRAVMLLPVLAPSLLPALALITLFGNQGLLRGMLGGGSIYGPAGIVAAQSFYCFPHAALILAVALGTADARLYEAATVLRAGHARIFATVTLPAARYGLVSAAVVTFTLVLTDFGIPKVIGGSFPVLATDVYKQVVGLQNFNMGAVVGLVLLLPAVGAFLLDRRARGELDGRRAGMLSGRALPYRPRPRRARDWPLFLLCLLVAGALLGVVGTAAWSSLVRFWPYDLSLTLDNYAFARFDATGWAALGNSIRMAALAALFGTAMVFGTAWLLERGAREARIAPLVRLLATLPLAVPGLVLGLAYILFFNHPANPLGFLYGTLAILVLNSLVHFYTVPHLAAVTAIRQLDPEIEAAGASLRVPALVTFRRVTVPICLPAILDLAVYIFVNAMTTVSAVIFLYGPDTRPASVAVVHMDEAGQASAAAAMAVAILGVTVVAKLLQLATAGVVDRATQRWRRR